MSLVRRLLIRSLNCPRYARDDVTEAEILDLAASIEEDGVLEALTAYRDGGDIIIDDGKTRVIAARHAGLKSVPVVLIDRNTGLPEGCEFNLVAECKRPGLSPTEEARSIKRLMDETKLTAAEAGRRLGLTAVRLKVLLALLSLPTDVQAHIESGRITPRTALRIAKVEDPKQRSRILQRTRDRRVKHQ